MPCSWRSIARVGDGSAKRVSASLLRPATRLGLLWKSGRDRPFVVCADFETTDSLGSVFAGLDEHEWSTLDS
jgi:hypothetical protein